MAESRLCSIPECGKATYCRGWCVGHYRRVFRYGSPHSGGKARPSKGTVREYLHDIVLQYDGEDCLLWPYAKSREGYAKVTIDQVSQLVSRYVCTSVHGDPLGELDAAHSCGKGHLGCVTKKHLSWKTRSDNNLDKVMHDTHNRGERNPNAVLTETQARFILSQRDKLSYRALARMLGANPATVHSVLKGRSWAWLS
jgi:hypothetical protein